MRRKLAPGDLVRLERDLWSVTHKARIFYAGRLGVFVGAHAVPSDSLQGIGNWVWVLFAEEGLVRFFTIKQNVNEIDWFTNDG